MTRTMVADLSTPDDKLPKLDLDALFAAQKANMAAVHEIQNVLLGAAQAIAKVQSAFAEQVMADARVALESRQLLPSSKALQATSTKAVAVTREVLDLTVSAQQHLIELLSARGQASVEELRALAA